MDVLQLPRSDAPTRIAPLAKLPVFWALEGKRVIVAGGSDAAAWKAELLAACGAQVHVYADALSDTFEKLILRGADHPQAGFTHHPRVWNEASFAGAAIAIADCEEDSDAQAFFEAACMAGVPVNVIDKPAFCQFQFGSIVNRSPVIVSISTDGAAPILAQAIRRRIEAVLPQSLKSWAELAQSIRDKINKCLPPGPQRRLFWERFCDRAFGPAPDERTKAAVLMDAARVSAKSPSRGRVILVGAGSGDAELLTLKAIRALQAADVILFDDLVSTDVLELARREAKRMLVGKRGGRTSCRQEDINDMMVKLAKAGKCVVRLKSGDPTMLGCDFEGIARLEAERIPVDIVPGIASATQTHRHQGHLAIAARAAQAAQSDAATRHRGGHLGSEMMPDLALHQTKVRFMTGPWS
ncbi:uroporphyrin-III C-methyltransferase [Rhizobium freirei PRF 81]|uniref:Uroporphyrin-III C-methyltransferase n=1 Tax=Rhizobium freirei PRF 81 TaxID=363754 RepID=N6UV97_9HYPH|nr:SAM-dependent methyltransferase [Rhizobium freirei]ENN84681.1 uroporphyrin-III C-methyltransferase [Rhizobium freirei PRF 81]